MQEIMTKKFQRKRKVAKEKEKKAKIGIFPLKIIGKTTRSP